MGKVLLKNLFRLKEKKEKIVAITAYDAFFAKLVSDLGIELILVGDSLGVTILGHETTHPVTIEDMIYYTKAAASLKPSAYLMADMPFQTYAAKEMAYQNASKLIQAGCEMVKLEGGAFLAETIQFLTDRGIPVCGHLGLLPQYCHIYGGYEIDTKQQLAREETLIHDARILEEVGCKILILKCVKSTTAEKIAGLVTIPVVGIGAGPSVDGQIQILQDFLGFSGVASALLSTRYLMMGKDAKKVRYTRDFLSHQRNGLKGALKNYITAVKEGQFPSFSEFF